MSNPPMTPTVYQKMIIGLAGVTAAAIGLAITFFPAAFYASYNISIEMDPSLLSELRAPGANLAALGVFMVAGAVRSDWFATARLFAIIVFFAFVAGRLVSWGIDGTPNASILSALAIEFVIGVLAVLASRPSKMAPAA
ncbi:MAG: DUF4345 domain-containing protein [Pseudomonadota bacterium]